MKVFALYGKTVKELVEIFKSNGHKYSLYKSKRELINGLIVRRCFAELKRLRVERLEEELQKLRNEEDEENIEDLPTREQIGNSLISEDAIREHIAKFEENYPGDSFQFTPINDEFKSQIYCIHKDRIMKTYDTLGAHGEQILLHGTEQENIESILHHDLSLNGNPIHGNVYGRGLYFTNGFLFIN